MIFDRFSQLAVYMHAPERSSDADVQLWQGYCTSEQA